MLRTISFFVCLLPFFTKLCYPEFPSEILGTSYVSPFFTTAAVKELRNLELLNKHYNFLGLIVELPET